MLYLRGKLDFSAFLEYIYMARYSAFSPSQQEILA